MNSGRTIFSQLMDFLPRDDFHRCVQRYNGDHKIKTFSCFDQYLAMVFAQLTGRDYQKTTGSQAESLHFATDFKFKPVRENACFTGLFANKYIIRKTTKTTTNWHYSTYDGTVVGADYCLRGGS